MVSFLLEESQSCKTFPKILALILEKTNCPELVIDIRPRALRAIWYKVTLLSYMQVRADEVQRVGIHENSWLDHVSLIAHNDASSPSASGAG